MRRVTAIAYNTFLEALRQRVLYVALGFSLFLIGTAKLLSPLALGEAHRVVRDVGLSAVSLCGMFLIVMVGTSLLQKELERRSIYVLLSKPVSRSEYLLGKYLGLLLMLACTVALMVAGVLVVDRWMGHRWNPLILLCGLGTLAEMAVLTAWTILFSVLASPFLAGLFTLGCYVIGNAIPALRDMASLMPVGGQAVTWISYALPNLYLFNLRPQVAEGIWPEPAQLEVALLYATLYTALILVLSNGLFRRKEFV
jgi:ABC-type transport system involved in multi-copper enzyme maturation permease subunit